MNAGMNQETRVESTARTPQSVPQIMGAIGRAARAAALALNVASSGQKNLALKASAAALRARRHKILAANDRDVREATAKGLSPAMLCLLYTSPSPRDCS